MKKNSLTRLTDCDVDKEILGPRACKFVGPSCVKVKGYMSREKSRYFFVTKQGSCL